jgi:hypothetical protein
MNIGDWGTIKLGVEVLPVALQPIDGPKDAFFLRSHASFLFTSLLNSRGKALTGSLHVLEGGGSDLV